jgi:N-acetylmuramoyl-L-alanine amidase
MLVASSAAIGQVGPLSGLKFCIDPGHGGNDPANDRLVIPDPGVEFWESESNFRKALSLDTLLEARGAWVILTRYTNTYPGGDEPSLTARWTLANNNNVNWFHSIHSNATGLAVNTSINSTLVLIKEVIATRQPAWPQAVTMSSLIYSDIRKELRTQPTGGNIAPGVYLDYTFYGGPGGGGFNLGVLNGLAMPGELSEGSMHDFYPETRRLMNNDYRKLEAYGILSAFESYFGAPQEPSGRIAGLQTESGTGRVLNGTTVRLLPEDRVYSGDQMNNGFFSFENLPPGAHTVRYETPGFALDSVSVNVAAGATTFADRALVPALAPTVSLASPARGDTAFPASEPIRITFSLPMDSESVESRFSLVPAIPGTLRWFNGWTELVYTPDSLLPFYASYTLTIGDSARSLSGYLIDGNGDGVAGDAYVATFKTAYVDVVPHVASYTPVDGDSTVAVYRAVTITFDRAMDAASTQAAFSITPPAPGTFAWSADKRTLTLTPASLLLNSSAYTVLLTRGAKSSLGWPLDAALQFSFSTSVPDQTGPAIVRAVPTDGATDVAVSTSFRVDFDEPVVYASFPGRVSLVDAADSANMLSLGSVVYTEPGFKGRLTFAPISPLAAGHTYRLRFLPGLKDPLGNLSTGESRFEFTTTAAAVPAGVVVDSLENVGATWGIAPSSSGIDTSGTHLAASALRKRSGLTSARLTYAFSGAAAGVCGVDRSSAIPMDPLRGWCGVWIYGDAGGNAFDLLFAGHGPLALGPIDWMGWRFVTAPIPAGSTGLSGWEVRQVEGAESTGELYVDDVQTELATGVDAADERPAAFTLDQNYPNPFNPATTIGYELPSATFVTLDVFDVLGRRVATLVSGVQQAGAHRVRWDARGIASGEYFCRLTAGGRSLVRSLYLLR